MIQIVELLEKYQAEFTLVDPHVKTFKAGGKEYETQELTTELLEMADLVLITTDHSDFDYEEIADKAKVIFDTRNALKDVQNIKADYEKL